ncbi:MAG: hypothetical protein ACRDX8_13130 [Acidimicrobiales bacterium]
MPSARVQNQAPTPDADARSLRATDEFLGATDADFGPVPEEVLAEVRAQWPE